MSVRYLGYEPGNITLRVWGESWIVNFVARAKPSKRKSPTTLPSQACTAFWTSQWTHIRSGTRPLFLHGRYGQRHRLDASVVLPITPFVKRCHFQTFYMYRFWRSGSISISLHSHRYGFFWLGSQHAVCSISTITNPFHWCPKSLLSCLSSFRTQLRRQPWFLMKFLRDTNFTRSVSVVRSFVQRLSSLT